ncbi:hypothetical protein B1A65_12015 [Corynebacterium diphtheriae]|nr:hypothetical protein B1A65_12015 [Corynebacterium diphtheriae]
MEVPQTLVAILRVRREKKLMCQASAYLRATVHLPTVPVLILVMVVGEAQEVILTHIALGSVARMA